MNTGRDPYSGLIRQMRLQGGANAPPGMCRGVVTAVGPDTLSIRTDSGLMLYREDLVLNASLAWDAEEELTLAAPENEETGAVLTVDQAVRCFMGFTHMEDFIKVYTITLYDVPGVLTGRVRVRARRLKAGDAVLMQPSADGQTYYVLCKVVDA